MFTIIYIIIKNKRFLILNIRMRFISNNLTKYRITKISILHSQNHISNKNHPEKILVRLALFLYYFNK